MTTKVSGKVLGTDAVDSANIKNGAVVEAKYGAASIPSGAFKAGAVNSAAIGDDQVDTQHLAAGAVDNTALDDDAVTGRTIAANTIETEHVLSLNGSKLLENSVLGPSLAPELLITEHFSQGAVTSYALADSGVITQKIAANAVSYAKMQTGTANSILYHNAAGAVAALAPGAESSVLSISSGVPVWSGSVIPTGTLVDFFGTGAPGGWVMADGLTIGSASSSATSLANSQTQSLFSHLWNSFPDSICPVLGGRGVSASADWTANKAITLPDLRGRTTVGVDTTGTPAGRVLTAKTPDNSSGSVTTVGHGGGAETFTLETNQMPAHKHLMFVINPTNTTDTAPSSTTNATVRNQGNSEDWRDLHYSAAYTEPTVSLTGTAGGTSGTTQPTNKMPPFLLVCKIIKL